VTFFYSDDFHVRLFNEYLAAQFILFADKEDRRVLKQLNHARAYSGDIATPRHLQKDPL
jgi:hypothetical protein